MIAAGIFVYVERKNGHAQIADSQEGPHACGGKAMTLRETEEFAALKVELQRVRAELFLAKRKLKGAECIGYNRAYRKLAKHPTGGLLTATYRQGRRSA